MDSVDPIVFVFNLLLALVAIPILIFKIAVFAWTAGGEAALRGGRR